MKYLSDLGFDDNNIKDFEDNTPDKLISVLEDNQKLVTTNINYLKNLGVKKYQEVFVNYPDMFLMDNSNFEEVFSKYELQDLIEKIDKNISIVEFL